MNNERFNEVRNKVKACFLGKVSAYEAAQMIFDACDTHDEAAEFTGRLLRERMFGPLHESIQESQRAEYTNLVPGHSKSGRKL